MATRKQKPADDALKTAVLEREVNRVRAELNEAVRRRNFFERKLRRAEETIRHLATMLHATDSDLATHQGLDDEIPF